MAYNPHQPAVPLKDPGIALILTLVGFVFVAGLQYLYIGKYVKGILFLLTLGFLYVGTVISLFTIRGETIRKNERALR